jgi:hypothetical protein
VLIDVLAFGLIIPVLPHLVESFVGGDTEQAAYWIGIFGTVFAAIQFLTAPVQGALSDRFGRRPVILLSCLGLGLDAAARQLRELRAVGGSALARLQARRQIAGRPAGGAAEMPRPDRAVQPPQAKTRQAGPPAADPQVQKDGPKTEKEKKWHALTLPAMTGLCTRFPIRPAAPTRPVRPSSA